VRSGGGVNDELRPARTGTRHREAEFGLAVITCRSLEVDGSLRSGYCHAHLRAGDGLLIGFRPHTKL